MKIERDGKTFELNEEELEQAYREQLHNYHRMDAANHFLDMFGDAKENFKVCYRHDVEEMSQMQDFLDAIVERYEDNFDCNVSINQMWEDAVISALDGCGEYDARATAAFGNASGSLANFERMEEKAQRLLDEAAAMADLNEGDEDPVLDLEKKYGAASAVSVDEELAALKAEMGL